VGGRRLVALCLKPDPLSLFPPDAEAWGKSDEKKEKIEGCNSGILHAVITAKTIKSDPR